MTANTSDYTDLIVPEHWDKPKYFQVIEYHARNAVDSINLTEKIPALFDVDVAVGQQEDFVGQWIGRTRYLPVPLTDVYFSLDIEGQGFDQGVWYEPNFNPTTGLVRLPDDLYRTLLYATIAANQWDGTIPGAYVAFNTIFQPLGYKLLIQDYGDMTMAIALMGPALDAVTLGLFTTGELDLRPGGVKIIGHVTQTVLDVPYFGFDVENSSIAGFDVGAWGNFAFAE